MQTADCRPQTADRRLQTADCRLQTAYCYLRDTNCKIIHIENIRIKMTSLSIKQRPKKIGNQPWPGALGYEVDFSRVKLQQPRSQAVYDICRLQTVRDDVRAQSARPSGRDSRKRVVLLLANVMSTNLLSLSESEKSCVILEKMEVL